MVELDRRSFTLGLGLGLAAVGPVRAAPNSARSRLAVLERDSGGRLGVCVIDAAGRVLMAYRADERFLLCSTFKAFLAGAILQAVDRGRERLDRRVPVSRADLVFYSPAVEKAVDEGAMTVEALCTAAVVLSDNAAGNLLLAQIGGPAALTAFFRSLGGRAARLDRREPDLNRRDGDKDTVTPEAAARMLRRLLAPGMLTAASRARLEGWMIESRTGRARLRAGLPPEWRAGDKTGTGANGETHDLAFVDRLQRDRLFVAAYYGAPGRPLADRQAVLAEVGRMIVHFADR